MHTISAEIGILSYSCTRQMDDETFDKYTEAYQAVKEAQELIAEFEAHCAQVVIEFERSEHGLADGEPLN